MSRADVELTDPGPGGAGSRVFGLPTPGVAGATELFFERATPPAHSLRARLPLRALGEEHLRIDVPHAERRRSGPRSSRPSSPSRPAAAGSDHPCRVQQRHLRCDNDLVLAAAALDS